MSVLIMRENPDFNYSETGILLPTPRSVFCIMQTAIIATIIIISLFKLVIYG